MRTHIFIHTYVCASLCVCKCICVCVYIYIHICTHKPSHTHMYIYIYIFTNVYLNIYVYAYMHICIYIYTYIYIFIYIARRIIHVCTYTLRRRNIIICKICGLTLPAICILVCMYVCVYMYSIYKTHVYYIYTHAWSSPCLLLSDTHTLPCSVFIWYHTHTTL